MVDTWALKEFLYPYFGVCVGIVVPGPFWTLAPQKYPNSRPLRAGAPVTK